ncbi:MAG: FtsX-like permease family protein [Gemmataceae bacterium]
MTFLRLLLANLWYFGRGNLAVALGVAVGATVLTGALLVGDSLQGSLREQSARRLSWVTHSLTASRFFREQLSEQVAEKASARVEPVLLLQATVRAGEAQARKVTVLGVAGSNGQVGATLSSALARALNVQVGDSLTVRLQKQSDLPREAALAHKEAELTDWTLQVDRILTAADEGDTFNLRPQLEAPRNLFVSLAALQKQIEQPGRINALLAAGDGVQLQAALENALDLEDWGLRLHTPRTRAKDLLRRLQGKRGQALKKALPGVIAERLPTFQDKGEVVVDEVYRAFATHQPYLALESRSLLLTPPTVQAALAAAEPRLRATPTLVYLCKIQDGPRTLAGVVAAIEPGLPPPLGPFLPEGVKRLADDEIVPAGWTPQSKEVTLRFKPPEMQGDATDRTQVFRVAGTIALEGPASDPYLTPEFPGITDKDDSADWKLPFDDPAWQQQRIRAEYTSAYWDRYRATPKAYITLAAGQRLWASRFGAVTSVRLMPQVPGGDWEELAQAYRVALLRQLKPAEGGFVFDDLKTTAQFASQGGTPFGLLFLGFSLFLIGAALLLVGLLYRLELERRARQVGVMLAQGFPVGVVRWLYLAEGGLVALAGVLTGTVLALLYSRLLLQLLAVLWPGGVLASFLAPHATLGSLNLGAMAAFIISVGTIAWSVRVLGQVTPRLLLTGRTNDDLAEARAGVPGWVGLALLGCIVLAGLLLWLGPQLKGHEAQAGTFFGSGALFLSAGLMAAYAWMRRSRGGLASTLTRLGLRNAARAPLRSLLTVGLLASASFLLVAVESFRRHPKAGNGQPSGPDGGFALIAETDLPVVRDLNSDTGRQLLLDRYEAKLAGQGLEARLVREKRDQAERLLQRTTIVGLRARTGDDASCLNLYKPRTPRLLGIPSSLIARGGFQFDATAAKRDHPWTLLEASELPYPCFGESNTVVWMLQRGLGSEITVPDQTATERRLKIAGLLHDSVFQSALLLSEANFLRLYPDHEGYHFFLIAPPSDEQQAVAELLRTGLADRGIEVTRSVDRLAAYLAVENTYLTTFQALGGLGLILGSLGLAVVLLRAVWERRAELALLRALGYSRWQLAWLLLIENGFLLLLGLGIGTVSALLSISPQMLSGAGSVPIANLVLLFAGVLAVGLVACGLATASVVRAELVPALRKE